METLGKASRILFGAVFGIFGIFHFINAGAMAGLVPIPGGVFWVYFTGLIFLAVCASFLIGKKVRLAGIGLGILLIIFVLSIHIPSVVGGDQMAMTNLLKDLALAAGAWYIASQYREKREVATATSGSATTSTSESSPYSS